jgi:DNA-binding NarL/FixJ family response regulator
MKRAVADRSVLLVEDSDADAQLYETMLQELQANAVGGVDQPSVTVDRVGTLGAALDFLSDGPSPDVVLLDLNLPDSERLETLGAVLDVADTAAVVVLTGVDDGAIGREAVSEGAQDFLVKDHVTPRVLSKTVDYAVERKRQTAAIERQRRELAGLNWLIRHDIRNDATVVLGWTDAIDPDGPVEKRALSRVEEAGESIVEATESAGALLQALDGDDEDELEPVDLKAVLEEEVDHLETRHEDVSVAFDPPEGTVSVVADQFLGKVLRSLFSKTVRESVADPPTVSVAVTDVDSENDPARVRVEVVGDEVDVGTAVENPPPTAGDEGTGTDLDLFLVETFVERYGGDLELELGDNGNRDGTGLVLERTDR